MINNEKERIWQEFGNTYRLQPVQIDQFQTYVSLLQEWNKRMNLTAITDLRGIILYHFQDSLEIRRFIDFNAIHAIADIGTGAGFPGIPLKIVFPHLHVLLIEVNKKRIHFLREVIDSLALLAVQIIDLDWRTFLRQTDQPIDLFLARASLQPAELIRMFKDASPYNKATLIYWASEYWRPSPVEECFIYMQKNYKIGGKRRKYIFFVQPKGS